MSGLPFLCLGIKNEIFHQIKIKKITMKKLFIVLAVASLGFVACNNESKTEETADSLTNKVEETADAMKDSVEASSDSVKSAIDSTASAVKDSIKK